MHEQIEAKKAIPREAMHARGFRTKKIFVGGLSLELSQGERVRDNKIEKHERVHQKRVNAERCNQRSFLEMSMIWCVVYSERQY